jgi:acetyl-CoA carboxylase biotin carboxylase subunit
MIRRLLIANRGEIAVRIIRACRERGVESVAVYSDADAYALHVELADRAVRLGPAPAAESYLDIDRVLAAARESGADAIHPGYGFLSENPELASACETAGMVFVGPSASAIAAMGSKTAARALAQAYGVPVVPGDAPADQSDRALSAAIERLGLPVLVKPSAGGGGIGMKTITETSEIAGALAAARRDAVAAFGDASLYVERLVVRPRHVEIQVLADAHGAIVHLLERECSLQRRHQKVIEESPSVALTPALRARMGEAAVTIARAAGYRNAGTVEFLLDGSGDEARFYFLEMNTRLQVEHPVTEAVAGIDLVQAQLDIAEGAPLPWTQDRISGRGHAIECRVYAEDPGQGFLPQAGPLLCYREPTGPGVRVDGGVREGGRIPVHYDPLVAKLIVHAGSRADAIARARAALARFVVLGVTTNITYLQRILAHADFGAGDIDTTWLDRQHQSLTVDQEAIPAAAVAAAAHAPAGGRAPRTGEIGAAASDPWQRMNRWRANAS